MLRCFTSQGLSAGRNFLQNSNILLTSYGCFVSTWSPLGSAFNSRPYRKLNFSFSRESAGLFGIPDLINFHGFYTLKDRALDESEHLVAEAISTNRSRKMVQIFDDLSDTLCRVADLSEFIRVSHNHLNFAAAAEDASLTIGGLVEKLNTNVALYTALKRVVEQGDIFPEDEIDRYTAKLFLFDFEQNGIHLEETQRQKVVLLNENILKIGASFMEGTQQPTVVNRESLPVEFRSCFPQQGDSIIIAGTHGENPNDMIREAAYRLYFHKDNQQETRLINLLKSRNKLSELCGFPSYAHRATRGTMGENPEMIMEFLESLADRVSPEAEKDLKYIREYKASKTGSAETLHPWDIPFYTAMAKHEVYNVDQMEFASYFSLGACMEGLNNLFQELYNVTLRNEDLQQEEVWSDDVYKLAVVDEEGVLGYIYCDFFERMGKPQQDCHFTIQGGRRLEDGTYQMPIVVILLNLPAPSWTAPSLLTPGMMENLFHEMGHAMHSMLGRTKYQHVTGTRCSTDFAEVPSVLMEYFASDPRVLRSFARHYKTGKTIPEHMLTSLCTSKYMFNACECQLQIFYSILDQRFHGKHPLEPGLTEILAETQNKYYCLPHVPNTTWHLRFAHLVGYGAKYYAYLMSRAVASKIWHDCFLDDPFNREMGEVYRREVLAHGGGKPPRSLVEGMLNKRLTTSDLVKSLTDDFRSHR